jgi:arylsulfatase A-like enzyme
VDSWESIPQNERGFQSRLMEVYAGFLEHTDAQFGKIVDELEAEGIRDNTMILYLCSDNGASGEGVNGTISELLAQNGMVTTVQQQINVLDRDYGGLDALGGRVVATRDTATNPAVLDAFALALIAGGDPHTSPDLLGHEPDLAVGRKAAVAITAADELREIAPFAGAYVSEGNFFDKAWQTSFWGSNYPKLAEVKKKYDPAGLFFVHHGVGSEEWSPDGFTKLPGR